MSGPRFGLWLSLPCGASCACQAPAVAALSRAGCAAGLGPQDLDDSTGCHSAARRPTKSPVFISSCGGVSRVPGGDGCRRVHRKRLEPVPRPKTMHLYIRIRPVFALSLLWLLQFDIASIRAACGWPPAKAPSPANSPTANQSRTFTSSGGDGHCGAVSLASTWCPCVRWG